MQNVPAQKNLTQTNKMRQDLSCRPRRAKKQIKSPFTKNNLLIKNSLPITTTAGYK